MTHRVLALPFDDCNRKLDRYIWLLSSHKIEHERIRRMPAVVDKEKCTGCEACVSTCPVEAIAMKDSKAEVTDACVDCGQCVDACPVQAIEMK